MAKVFLGIGHGGSDPGAVANGYREKDMTLAIGTACKNYLERNGVSVKMSRYRDEEDSVTQEVNECNAYAPDLAVDVHINAGGGDGFEVFHTLSGGKGKVLAQNIEAEVKAAGQNSRGVKTKAGSNGRDYYAFIRGTVCPAVICELGFIDNWNDLSAFDEAYEQNKFGEAYARGILKTLGISDSGNAGGNSGGSTGGYVVRITASALNVRSGPGTSYGINTSVKKNEAFTIVEERNGWGRLKSGAGWISLNYTERV